jgi:hypothetical protein
MFRPSSTYATYGEPSTLLNRARIPGNNTLIFLSDGYQPPAYTSLRQASVYCVQVRGLTVQASEEKLLSLRQVHGGARYRVAVRERFARYFPTSRFPDYRALFGAAGEAIKTEARTRVALLTARAREERPDDAKAFVLKCYSYPFLPRIRTGFSTAKAEREFKNLLTLGRYGVLAVEPVAFGVERTRVGFVRSCFLITRFVEASENLTSQAYISLSRQANGDNIRDSILKQIGRHLRHLHNAGFFLFTPKAKNILFRQGADGIVETLFVDIPYARTLRWRPLARLAQGRDLGVFLGSFLPEANDGDLDLFYETYLPDPLGATSPRLRRRVIKCMRAKQNRTFLSSLIHGIKRRWRTFPRRHPASATP